MRNSNSFSSGVFGKKQGYFTKRRQDSGTTMFLAALSTISRVWKKPTCPRIEDKTKKLWHINTRQHYSATRKDKAKKCAATWRDPQSILLNEVGGKQKDQHKITSLKHGI